MMMMMMHSLSWLLLEWFAVGGGGGSSDTRSAPASMLELRVSRVLKGNGATSTLRTVSVIGPCRLDVDVDATYVVFAVAANSAWSESDQVDPAARLYGVLGRPLPASRRVIRQVVDYAQNGGESTPYCHLCRHSAFVALANLRYINALNNNNNNNNGILRWARLARVMHRPSVRPSVRLSVCPCDLYSL